MTVKGCMFDFSGTVFRIEPARTWLRAALDAHGLTAAEDDVAGYARLLERAGAQPGGDLPGEIPPHLERLWRDRDLSPEWHRAAYTGLSRTVALPWDVHDTLYARQRDAAAWQPYPDAEEVLRALRERGVPVAVVSNIGWDLRPVFRAHALDGYVDAFVLSYEHGVKKPDPRIFALACDALGVPPRDTVMVGDQAAADGGAAALGCRVLLVDPRPVAQRPDALRGVLDLLG
ncbi:HAD family hydrolase [Streptomyces sp. HPF1205]|uniref:HAD family hydrolase n=1 Tax=Streptomyces sp. HPF1205 TaxID=2873262 RepID=UPI001CEC1948|nr:HAD-IA family hydrolase [Streptomyces sp. HPF1205]